MNKIILKYILSFVLIVLAQVFVFNKINMFGFISPMIYIVFIFSLPFKTMRWLVVLLGFLTGLVLDSFTGVIGIHSIATLIIAFARPFIIRTITLRVELEDHLLPVLQDMKFAWYLQYAFLLTFIHHSVYFFADVLSFENFGRTMIVILANTAFSLICIFLIQLLFYKASKRY